VPPLDLAEQAEGPERPGRGGQREQQDRADAELQRGSPHRTSHRGRQLDVGGGLQREQAADEEEERDGEGFHGRSLSGFANLTAVKIRIA
jgi:hypothetical protein